LKERARDLLQAHWEEWVGPLREATRPAGPHFGEGWMAGGCHAAGLGKFHRGFVDTLILQAEDFLAGTRRLARLVPLRHLSLRGAGGRADALASCSYLHGVETLSFVDYFHAPLTASDAKALAASPHLGRVRALHLHRNNIGDGGLEALAGAGWLGGVKGLNLEDNGLSVAGVAALAASPQATHLSILSLGRNDLGDDAVQALASAPFLAGLHTLGLEAGRIGPEGAGVLAGAPLDALQTLALSGNPLGSGGAERLAVSARLSGLFGLHLVRCRLGDEGVEALARSPNLAGLRTLALENNGITDRGAAALARSPYLGRLQHLSLADNVISGAALGPLAHLVAGQ
jgi:Ran GTPase-activating protein (RanGAP) involved in mRNA processing and transport